MRGPRLSADKMASSAGERSVLKNPANGGMVFKVDGMEVVWPYRYVYPEQYEYMVDLKKTLDVGGAGYLQMPSGTGKTATILSFLLSYKWHFPERLSKIVYCTRTVPEIEKAMVELKKIRKHLSLIHI